MPEPTVTPTLSSEATSWLLDAPGGDIPFDDLFSDGGTAVEPAAQPNAPVTPPAQPPVVTNDEPFLKAVNTVYKTREEAERGIAQKDDVIARLRTLEIQRTGFDPLTGKRAVQEPQAPSSYRDNPKAYIDDLMDAATKQDHAKYLDTQRRLIYDVLEPIAPVISEFTKSQAVRQVTDTIKDFPAFLRSPDYAKTGEMLPELRDAIHLAESDINYAAKLPQLYKTLYYVHQGMKTPELVQTAVHSAQQPNQPTARPTTSPTTAAPPNTSAVTPSFTTSEGRKAIMEQLEGKVKDAIW